MLGEGNICMCWQPVPGRFVAVLVLLLGQGCKPVLDRIVRPAATMALSQLFVVQNSQVRRLHASIPSTNDTSNFSPFVAVLSVRCEQLFVLLQ